MSRRRFLVAWALGWAAIDVLLYTTIKDRLNLSNKSVVVRAASSWLSDQERMVVFTVGATMIGGLIGSLSAAALATTPRRQRRTAISLAAVACATVVANLYLATHPLPDGWYSTTTLSAAGPSGVRERTKYWNPWSVHLSLTLPLAGAATGVILATLRPGSAARARRVAGAACVWAAAFAGGGLVAIYANYLLVAGVIDLFEAVRLPAQLGKWLGAALAGALAGGAAARIGLVAVDAPARSGPS